MVELLEQSLLAAEAQHNTLWTLEILALLAAAYHSQGRPLEARLALRRALALARASAIVRPFLDLGRPMAQLLEETRRAGGDPHGYIASLLAAFDPNAGNAPGGRPAIPFEELTYRELEVLALLEQQLTNAEIAEKLVLTVGTVKQHTAHIYQKLHVANRRQAVAAARAAGLLTITEWL
jgi:LuxR family maltose regulon positive regulatory protein